MRRVVVAMLWVLACRSPSPLTGDAGPGEDATSDAHLTDAASKCPQVMATTLVEGGSRYRPVFWKSADGLDILAGLYDTLHGDECDVQDLSGSLYCARAPYPVGAPWYGFASAEPTCATHKVFVGGAGLANTVVSVGTVVALLGDEILPKPMVYCASSLSGTVPSAGYHVYAAPTDPTTTVLTIIAHEPRTVTAVDYAEYWRVDDGTALFSGLLWDYVHDGCDRPVTVLMDNGKWLPAPAASEPICNAFTSGDLATVDSIAYRMVPYSCTIQQPGGPVTLDDTKPGTVVPYTEFDDAPTVVIGGSRLVLSSAVPTDGGFAVMQVLTGGRTVHDNALGIDCRPELASDGVLRCLPADTNHAAGAALDPYVWYADAACTQPILLAGGAAPAAFARLARGLLDSCSPRVYSAGAQIATPSAIYGQSTCGACTLVTSSLTGYTAYTATEVAPTTFAPITTEIR